MSIIYVDENLSCDSMNKFMSKNVSNIDCIVIDFSLLMSELISIGVLSIDNTVEDFKKLKYKIFNNEFFKMKKSISSMEMIDELSNKVYEESTDSFLFGAFLYSIPVFIERSHLFNVEEDFGLCIDQSRDARIISYIKDRYDISELYLIKKHGNDNQMSRLLDKMTAMSMGKNIIYEDEKIEDKERSEFLYDELVEKDW